MKDKEQIGSELFTYDEWHALGYGVLKGQKSVGRDKNGRCVFNRNQVTQLSDRTIEKMFDEVISKEIKSLFKFSDI